MSMFLQSCTLLCFLGFHATVAIEIFAQVGDDVSINLPYDSTTYLTFLFDNKQLGWVNTHGGKFVEPEWKDHVTLSNEKLVIKSITQKNFGTFTCVVKKQFEEIARHFYKVSQINLTVNSPILLPEEQLSLSCKISQGNAPQIYWLSPQGNKIGNRGEATVQASSSHSGWWTCVVNNNTKGAYAKIKVTVIDLLPPNSIPTQYTSTSRSLTIPCSISTNTTWDDVKAKGIEEVGWYFCPSSQSTSFYCNQSSLLSLSLENKPTWKALKDKTLRPRLNLSSGDLSLGRNQWREGDSGDYVCFMKFQNNVELSRTVRVELLQIIASPGTELTSGQQLNLFCTTGHPLPSDLQVKWFPPNETSLQNTAIHDLRSPRFTIPEVGKDEKGTWRCELWRGETILTSAVVELNIVPKKTVWMLVTLCAAGVIFLLLLILIVILHQRKQRRTRRHRRLCHCENPKPKGFYRS